MNEWRNIRQCRVLPNLSTKLWSQKLHAVMTKAIMHIIESDLPANLCLPSSVTILVEYWGKKNTLFTIFGKNICSTYGLTRSCHRMRWRFDSDKQIRILNCIYCATFKEVDVCARLMLPHDRFFHHVFRQHARYIFESDVQLRPVDFGLESSFSTILTNALLMFWWR